MTVRELAELCGVHYNTVRKWLADEKVPKADQSRNAPFVIDDEVIQRALKNFKVEPEDKDQDQSISDMTYSYLIKQLDSKDKQIAHLQKLLEQQQILTLQANEQVLLAENTKAQGFWDKLFKKKP